MSLHKHVATLNEEKIVTTDIKTKLIVAKNVAHACINGVDKEKSITSSSICDKVQYLTGISNEVALKIVNGTSYVFSDRSFRDWYNEGEYDHSKSQQEFSSRLRDILVDHFVYKKRIPTLSSLSQYYGNKMNPAEIKIRLRRAGYLWKGVPGTTKAILVENTKQICDRQKYLETIQRYREEKWHIVYLDEKFIKQSGEMINYVDPDEDKVTWFCLAVSGQLGILSHAVGKNMPKSEFNSILEEWISYLIQSTGPRCVFVFEEKPHHEKCILSTPTIYSSAEEMLKWLVFHKIPHDSDWHRAELFKLINKSKKHFPCKIYKVDEDLHRHGHKILRRPREAYEFDFFQPFWNKINISYFNINNFEVEMATIMTVEKTRNWAGLETSLIKKERKVYKDDIAVENAIDQLLTLAKYDESSRAFFENCDDHIDETKLSDIIQV